jgi:hypothetical protein
MAQSQQHSRMLHCETVPGTGEAARFPAETLGTHKDGNTEYNVTSTGSPTVTPYVTLIEFFKFSRNKAASLLDWLKSGSICKERNKAAHGID